MRHFLNDIEIAPRNLQDIGFISDWSGRPAELQLNVDKIVLPREGKEIIEAHVQQLGVFEGIPYRVEMAPGLSVQYYVDLTEEAIYRDHEIEVKIKQRLGMDSFWEKANGTSFELMRNRGVVFNFIKVPYVIIKDDQVALGLSLGVSLYVMTQQSINAIQATVELTASFIQAVTPNATVPPLPPLGAILALAVQLAAQIAFTVAVLLATVKLAQQFFELLFPKVRYYDACKVKELISKGCQYLGYTFTSTLLDSLPGLTILPVPLVKQKNSIFDYIQNDLNFAFTKGYPTAQDTTPTLGALIEAIETQFNAKTKILNGAVQLERRDYWQGVTPNQIVPALVVQDERIDEYTLNTDEIWKRYYIHYQVDYADIHTLDFYDPTDAEYSTEPTTIVNADLVSIKGLNDVNIPFALGVRKGNLNWLEKTAKALFSLIDAVTGIFGGGTNFAGQIQSRIGVLQIGQQFFGVSKMLYVGSDGKQPAGYVNKISARRIYENFHSINQIQNNDFEIRKSVRCAITNIDFVNLLNNNYADVNGELVEVLRVEFLDETCYAEITYKAPRDYADGKVITLQING
jgi:hypothetical protein